MTVFTVAPRPAEGTKGRPAIVTTNCFKVSVVKKLAFHQYHAISALPNNREVKSIARRRGIVQKLHVHDRPHVFQPGQVVYDGKAGLYTSKDLGDRDLHFELRESQQGANGSVVRIELKKVGYISSSEFDSLLRGYTDLALTAQQILNLLLYNATPPDFRKVSTRNTMFSMSSPQNVGMGLVFVRGCFASVRLAREHLLLNVDVCSAIMYDDGELPTVAAALLDLRDLRQLVNNPVCIQRLLSVLKRVRVEQIRAGKIGRIRTIRDIVPRAGRERFYLEDGTSTTVAEYFLHIHNYRLLYPDLPGIMVVKKDRHNENTDKKDIIPFELLKVVEGQFYQRKLNQGVHQEIHRLSKIRPDKRKDEINEYLEAFTPAALESAGLRVQRSLVSVRGRLLPPPKISIGRLIKEPREGVWRLPNRDPVAFSKPCTIKRCAVLIYERDCGEEFGRVLIKHLVSNFRFFGIDVSDLQRNIRSPIISHVNPQGNKEAHLSDLLAKIQENEGQKLRLDDFRNTLTLVILPGGGRSVIYEEIKRLGDTAYGPGMITQCLDWDVLKDLQGADSRNADAYLSNVVLKINVKMGGVNFIPKGEGLEWIHGSKKITMVVGLDVSHPGPGVFMPSMAGMVYSVDPYVSRYFPICSPQPPRVEIIVNLKKMISNALKEFSSETGKTIKRKLLPERLLVYRDGLSDGELANVCPAEIEAIKGAIWETYRRAPGDVARVPPEQVRITYVVVGKRHHIRFFPGRGEGDRSNNCPSGFVTDDKSITSPHVYDFFLQSHGGMSGTSRPAHYMVMRDENSLTSDELQSITFGLCHMFARATRAVSVPAPVYYAHLVCKRVGIHIRYKDDESALSTTQSGSLEFNEEDWQFYDIHSLQRELMYFA